MPLTEIGSGQVAGKNYDDLKLQEEGYKENAVVFRCIDMIAQEVAKVPFQLYQNDKLLEKHPLLELLLNPNPMQSKSEYIIDVISNKLISGNAYLEAAYAKTSSDTVLRPPIFLYSHNPSNIDIIKGSNGMPHEYKYTLNGSSISFPVSTYGRSNILHLKTFNPTDSWYGFSKIQAASQNIDYVNLSNEWNNNILKEGGNVSGVIEISDKISYTPQQMEDVRVSMKKFKGSQSKSIMSLPNGMTYKQMALSPNDMNFLEGTKVSAQFIAFVFGVPYDLVNTDQAKYENLEKAKELLWDNAVKPNLEHLITEMNTWIVPRYGKGLRLSYNEDAVEAISTKRDRKRQSLEGVTFMTVNEKRLAMGLEELGGGDTLLTEMNKIPLDQVVFNNEESLPEDEKSYLKSLITQGYNEKKAKILTGLVYDHSDND
tara:strand:+ start:185 stop:1468 length:1284 start_codon:yes stop_codon:yes gene_type:complete